MPDSLTIREAKAEDIEIIRDLAERTWRHSYPGIISDDQIDYMLGWMYSAEKIRTEMEAESITYLVAETVAPAGFASFGPGDLERVIFLHKLYVLPNFQRQGIGRALMEEIEKMASEANAEAIELRVNRSNQNALRTYEKAGFTIEKEICSDIGGGFTMDDFLMRRALR